MLLKKKLIWLLLTMVSTEICHAQLEVTRISIKDYKATGFGSFLNFSIPVSEAHYLTVEGGMQLFNKDGDEAGLFPVLLGYRYTLNQSGTGLYVEPHAGYTFGGTTIGVYDQYDSPVPDGNGGWLYEKVAGPTAGVGLGYLFEPSGKIQFNLGLRYGHTFGDAPVNLFAFRISHAFTFGRRELF